MARHLDVNQYLTVVGGIGRPQWIAFILIGCIVMQFGWVMLSVIFTLKVPNFRCVDEDYLTGVLNTNTSDLWKDGQCTYTYIENNTTLTKKCGKFVYNREHGETVIERFNLVCDRKYITTIIEMVYMTVVGVGSLIGSALGDRFGRKIVIIVAALITSVCGIIQAFSVNIVMYATFRLLSGLFIASIYSPSSSLLTEMVSPRRRPDILNGMAIFWILGASSLSLISYLLRDWWKLLLFCNAPGLLFGIAMIWGVYESPHWLATIGKTEEALEVLEKIAKAKNIDTSGLGFNTSACRHDDITKETANKESFLQVWRHKRLVIHFFLFSYGWLTCSICYYVLMFGVRTLPGNIYINNFISAAVEALGYLLCFLVAWLDPDKLVTAMSMVGKLCITSAWQIIIIWSSELYPTTHRCTLLALNTVISKVGSVLAPFILQLEDFIDIPNEKLIIPILFVALMAVGGILHIIPPETNQRRLPETSEEANVSSFPVAIDQPCDTNGMSEDEETEKHDLLLESMKTSQSV
ncbi:hypothetical protein EB796_020557 [Bugula neritina]|uniref:Major facilitator superfamily (MFS) profile domain-containing protein n=1 Tax=Bugula neritina TaxID=10212 RepID=A0A7J7J4W4_BUGNE|nr:hypothetical protein EB796_020557 [Bugula neritina]